MNTYTMVGVGVKIKVKGDFFNMKKDKLGMLAAIGTVVAAGAFVAWDYKTSHWNCRYCGTTFKAPFKEYFFAGHTPTRRKLHCPVCGNTGYFKYVRNVDTEFKLNNEITFEDFED